MIVDANLLLYAVDEASPQHESALEWWSRSLNGRSRVGVPWQTVGAFVRISTHPRITRGPLTAIQAWRIVESWMARDVVWVPPTTARTCRILGELLIAHGTTGNLVPDAQLAAIAIEHGVPVASADSDFARFSEVSWLNPLAR